MLVPVPPRRTPASDGTTGQEAPVAVVRLKVTLLEIVPPVWRRFQVPANFTLRRLHAVLQRVMGWNESPLHQFRAGGELFGMPSGDTDTVKDSRWITLQDLLSLEGRTFSYAYGFGERWAHHVRIEGVAQGDRTNQSPLCLAGEGPCPPAECDGPDAYLQVLEARHKQGNPLDHAFLGPDPGFDPQAFDLDGVNAALAALRF
jgi:hypothetical protein